MPTKSELKRNNVHAGLFTVIALLVGFAILVILNGTAVSHLFGSYNNYVLKFQLDDGVAGLSKGAEVRVGGLIRGRVTGIKLVGLREYTDESTRAAGTDAVPAPPSIDVTIELDGDIKLWSNAVAVRTPPVLGTTAWINISTVGGPHKSKNASLLPIDGSGLLDATPGDGLLTTIVGSTNAGTTKEILANIEEFTGFLDGPVINTFNQDIQPTLADAREVMGSFRNDYGGWSNNITTTLDNASETMQTISVLVRDNRQRLSDIVANIDVMTESGVDILNTVEQESLVKVNDALDKGNAAIGDLANMLQVLDLEVASSIPTIRNFLQDALVAAGELKLTTIELRRSPWRLLYTPKPDELAHENLFAASRSFMLASSNMRSAAESFQSILQQFPESLERDPELRADVERWLADSLKRFQEAQERLFSVIIDEQ